MDIPVDLLSIFIYTAVKLIQTYIFNEILSRTIIYNQVKKKVNMTNVFIILIDEFLFRYTYRKNFFFVFPDIVI